MRIELFDGPKDMVEEPVRLRLVPGHLAGTVVLRVVDQHGNRRPQGDILTIGPDGLDLQIALNGEFGFPRTFSGRINASANGRINVNTPSR